MSEDARDLTIVVMAILILLLIVSSNLAFYRSGYIDGLTEQVTVVKREVKNAN